MKLNVPGSGLLPMLAYVAWKNLKRKPKRFLSTVVGVGISALLVIIQISLLFGFVSAAENIVRRSNADLWIAPFGVPALEFASEIDMRHQGRLFGVQGVAAAEPIVAGFAEFTGPNGTSTAVALIGVSLSSSSGLPIPVHSEATEWHWGHAFLHDASASDLLGVHGTGIESQIGGRRIVSAGVVNGYGSFLGSPYIFVPIKLAREVLGMDREKTNYIAVKTNVGADPERIKQRLQALLPGQIVYTAHEFARKSSEFWLVRTGAGGGFLLSAILGLVVGVVIVYQTTYTNAMENVGEYATLKAVGMADRYILAIVTLEAAISGGIGGLLGIVLSFPAVAATQVTFVSWILTPEYLRIATFGLAVAMSMGAALGAIRMVLATDPVRVFRG